MKNDIQRKKVQKSDLLDKEQIARSNRHINNRLKTHEFNENGKQTITQSYIRETLRDQKVKPKAPRQINGDFLGRTAKTDGMTRNGGGQFQTISHGIYDLGQKQSNEQDDFKNDISANQQQQMSHMQSVMSGAKSAMLVQRSLHYVSKKREAERIDYENKKIMSHILKQAPAVSVKKLEQEYRKRLQFKKILQKTQPLPIEGFIRKRKDIQNNLPPVSLRNSKNVDNQRLYTEGDITSNEKIPIDGEEVRQSQSEMAEMLLTKRGGVRNPYQLGFGNGTYYQKQLRTLEASPSGLKRNSVNQSPNRVGSIQKNTKAAMNQIYIPSKMRGQSPKPKLSKTQNSFNTSRKEINIQESPNQNQEPAVQMDETKHSEISQKKKSLHSKTSSIQKNSSIKKQKTNQTISDKPNDILMNQSIKDEQESLVLRQGSLKSQISNSSQQSKQTQSKLSKSKASHARETQSIQQDSQNEQVNISGENLHLNQSLKDHLQQDYSHQSNILQNDDEEPIQIQEQNNEGELDFNSQQLDDENKQQQDDDNYIQQDEQNEQQLEQEDEQQQEQLDKKSELDFKQESQNQDEEQEEYQDQEYDEYNTNEQEAGQQDQIQQQVQEVKNLDDTYPEDHEGEQQLSDYETNNFEEEPNSKASKVEQPPESNISEQYKESFVPLDEESKGENYQDDEEFIQDNEYNSSQLLTNPGQRDPYLQQQSLTQNYTSNVLSEMVTNKQEVQPHIIQDSIDSHGITPLKDHSILSIYNQDTSKLDKSIAFNKTINNNDSLAQDQISEHNEYDEYHEYDEEI
ncbi:UNKNOWN [Stylonychia lemnae]|uniref:Uncharacterized protein n=1 Tax=Stylonychia lemnae TaxID=5949 RepID=A0A078AU70_STYLE|nr:UNKNOWN [Stylonychia lemnae]|eukprot:CDW85955.1 UNKNOWN [Stylonychia lemnae]